ncbi:MAG: hypothetical protein WCP69_13045 [Bacteroidota bacterium]
MKAKISIIMVVIAFLLSSCSVHKGHKHSIKTGNNGVGMDVKRSCSRK